MKYITNRIFCEERISLVDNKIIGFDKQEIIDLEGNLDSVIREKLEREKEERKLNKGKKKTGPKGKIAHGEKTVLIFWQDTDCLNQIDYEEVIPVKCDINVEFIVRDYEKEHNIQECNIFEFAKRMEEIDDAERVEVDTVPCWYDAKYKSAYISEKTLRSYCKKHNAWEIVEGMKGKQPLFDISVENNDMIEYVFIYNEYGVIDIEVDCRIFDESYEKLLEEIEMIPDNTQFYIDPYTLEKIPVEEYRNRMYKGMILN